MDNSFLHTKRLLLVDDEQELLKMVSDILKDAGFETVLTAMTVKEAILTAKEETPDLIVLDVMLPDGFFSDAAAPHFYQCADHFPNSKGRGSRQIIRIGAWGRRLHFKALYAAGIITAYLCGAAANLQRGFASACFKWVYD